MGFAITADAYVPMIPRKPGKFRKPRRDRGTSNSLIKTTNFKNVSGRVCKGMAKGAVLLYLAGGVGNYCEAIPAGNNRVFTAR